MGNVTTTKFVRKPLYVEAVQVTEENFVDIAQWARSAIFTKSGGKVSEGGENIPEDTAIDPDSHYIFIRVHNPQSARQSKAFVGDWILYTDRGYKIYMDKPFKDNFDAVPTSDPKPEVEKEATVEEEADTAY